MIGQIIVGLIGYGFALGLAAGALVSGVTWMDTPWKGKSDSVAFWTWLALGVLALGAALATYATLSRF